MKSQGVTDVQIGFLISLNFIIGTILALFAGVMVDKNREEKNDDSVRSDQLAGIGSAQFLCA